jgi:ketosteroid isomerase-like protein
MRSSDSDLVRAALEAWNRSWRDGDVDAALEFLQRDVVLDFSRNVFNPRVLKGHAGYRQLLAEVGEVWGEVHFEIEELRPAGDDVVVALVLARARGRTSGADTETRVAQVFRLREGKIAEIRAYADREEALRDAGVRG